MEKKQVIIFGDSINTDEINGLLLSRLNECYSERDITKLVLDFSKVSYVSVDAILPLLRALRIGCFFLTKNQPSFTMSIVDSTSPSFLYLYHTNFFSYLPECFELSGDQKNRLDYLAHNSEFNPENKIFGFEVLDEYKRVFDYDSKEYIDKFDIDYERYIRNKLKSLVYWNVRKMYGHTFEVIENSMGEKYCYDVTQQLIELVVNSIFHSHDKTYMYFQQGVYLPKKSSEIKAKATGTFIGVGDLGMGFKKSLNEKKDKGYLSFFSEMKERVMPEEQIHRLPDLQRRDMESLLGVFEAIYFSYYQELTMEYFGLYQLIKNVTFWTGIVTIISDYIEISFNCFNGFEEEMKKYVDILLTGKRERYLKILSRKYIGVQVNVEIAKVKR